MKRSKRPPILTAIVVDEYASSRSSRADEIAEHTERFTSLLGPPDVYTPAMFYEESIRTGTELVLFDYGGIGMGNSLLADNSRRLVQWAVDHPSALVVVVSRCTFQWAVRHEIMDAGFADPDGVSLVRGKRGAGGYVEEGAPLLPNVVMSDYDKDFIPKWWREGLHERDRGTARREPRRRSARR